MIHRSVVKHTIATVRDQRTRWRVSLMAGLFWSGDGVLLFSVSGRMMSVRGEDLKLGQVERPMFDLLFNTPGAKITWAARMSADRVGDMLELWRLWHRHDDPNPDAPINAPCGAVSPLAPQVIADICRTFDLTIPQRD